MTKIMCGPHFSVPSKRVFRLPDGSGVVAYDGLAISGKNKSSVFPKPPLHRPTLLKSKVPDSINVVSHCLTPDQMFKSVFVLCRSLFPKKYPISINYLSA